MIADETDGQNVLPCGNEMINIKLEEQEQLEPEVPVPLQPYVSMDDNLGVLHSDILTDSLLQTFQLSQTTMNISSKEEANTNTNKNCDNDSSGKILNNENNDYNGGGTIPLDGSMLLKCKQCRLTFLHPGDLQEHERICKKRFKCTYCEYSCDRRGNLEKHIRVHTGERPYSCDICGNRFKDTSNLNVHLLMHNGVHKKKKKR